MKVREDYTHGMMGRVPDYINRAITGYAAGASFLAEAEPRFGANAVRYYEHLRENDLCLTHALNPPQSNRAASTAKQADPSSPLGSRKRPTRVSSFAAAACSRRCRSPTKSWCSLRPC